MKLTRKMSSIFDDDGEERKGERVESRKPAVRNCIKQKPKAKPYDVQNNEREASNEAADQMPKLPNGCLNVAESFFLVERLSEYAFERARVCVSRSVPKRELLKNKTEAAI